jgi:two-component system, NtrC family, sensor histidine kinase HydH
MQAQMHPAGFEQIRREELARAFGRLFAVRRGFQPVMLAIMLAVVVSDGQLWRAVLLVAAPLFALMLTLAEGYRLKRRGVGAYDPTRDFLGPAVVIPVAALCTGGIRSPILAPMLAFLVFVPMSSRQLTHRTFILVVALVWIFALVRPHAPWMMPAPFLDEAGRINSSFDVFFAVVFTVFAVVASRYGIGLREMNDAMLTRSLSARAEALELYQERLRELTLLTGQIAHELKNPLASIKGLATLMRTPSDKNPRRLEVLAGEVERMQTILEEFLNFSRPLVPLSQKEVDVSEICRDVVGLHEGVAAAHRLTLVAPTERLPLRCDPRKVKQIVVNLVQNAVDASSSGGEVRVTLSRRDDFAAIQVLDRGHGLTSDLRDRAFDTGVTSKTRGSGLGLTIVRMLAEQHRGSARLFNREGGGCVAEVLLPRDGATEPAVTASGTA